jgi:hypothetical protein
MEGDQGDVLRNLPRRRPGPRSARRASARKGSERPAASAGDAAAKAEQRGAAAARPARRQAAAKRPRAARPAPAAAEARDERQGDPLLDAARTAVRLSATGAQIAVGVTREVLRRLPRP